MDNFIIVAVILVLVGLAAAYIIKAKKKGVKCIGCPEGGNCSHNSDSDKTECSGGCSCCCHSEDK